MEKINNWGQVKIEIAEIAQKFKDRQEPYEVISYDYYDNWKEEEKNWRNEEYDIILQKDSVKDAEEKAKEAANDINEWIQTKIEISKIARKFYETEPKAATDNEWKYYDDWKAEYAKKREEWREIILKSINENDANEKVELAWADINGYINQIIDEKTPKIIIVLDAGHGSGDPGATWSGEVDGEWKELIEANITEEIRYYVIEYLKQYGYIEIVESPRTRGDNLSYRALIAKEKKANMHISIHVNTLSSGTANGVFAYYEKEGDKLSISLAENISKGISETTGINDLGSRLREKNRPLAILSNSEELSHLEGFEKILCPSVVVETGFLVSEEDRKILSTHDGLKKEAQGIVKGILRYLGRNDKGYPDIPDFN